MSSLPWEDITKASLAVALESLDFVLLVTLMTHILSLETFVVHFPAAASSSSSSSTSFCIPFHVQVMYPVTPKHGKNNHKLERPWACRALWEEEGDPLWGALFS